MTISDTSRSALRYVEESVAGTTPASALTDLRITGESISPNFSSVTSGEIRSDRQITDSIRTGYEVSGDINFELSYGSFDELFEGALFSDWSTACAVSVTGDITAVNSTNSYDSTSTNFTTQNLTAGQWIKVGGFDTAGNNGYCRVVSISANSLVVEGLTLTDEGIGSPENTITMDGSFLSNGTTEHYYTIEKAYEDASPLIYRAFLGNKVSGMSLSVSSNAILTGSFSFMGLTASASASVTAGTGSPTAANTNDVYNASGNVANIREAGDALSSKTYATSLELSLDNGLSPQKAIGTAGSVGIGDGRCNVTGTLNTFLVTAELIDKLVNNTATSIDFRITDAAGNTYIFDMPRVKYQNGSANISGADADVEVPLDFQALRDPTLGYTISISRIPA